MESEKIARLTVPHLGNGVFQFPIQKDFTIAIELTELSKELFDNIYTLFDERYKLELSVINLRCALTGDIIHFEYKGTDDKGNITCVLKINNICKFVYDDAMSL